MTFLKKTIPIFFIFLILFSFVPFSVQAASIDCVGPSSGLGPDETPKNFKEVICLVLNFLDLLVPVIVGLTLLVFLWGLARFILAAGDENKIQNGKDLMIYGVIGLFVMVSVWGIVNILYGSFFGGSISLPLFESSSS